MTLFGHPDSSAPGPSSGTQSQTLQVDPVKSYCQRLSAALNPAKEPDRQLLQAMQNFRRTWPDKFRETAWVDLSFLIDLPHFDDDSSAAKGVGSNRKRKCGLHFPSPLRSVKRSCSRSKPVDSDARQAAVDRVSRLMAYLLENERYKTEGIFRKTGSCGRQKELRRQLLQCPGECSLAGYTVHDVASVLKLLLRGLEEPIVTDRLLELLLAIADLSSADRVSGRTEAERHLARCRQLHALRIFGQLLSGADLALLSSLLHFLHTVANCQETKMTCDSLGTVFGPVLFCAKSSTEASSLQRVERLNRVSAFLIANCYQLSLIPRSFAEKLAKQWQQLAHSSDDSEAPSACLIRFSGRPDTPATAPAAGDYGHRQVAALCAHIRLMPESREKHRLEKRFSHRQAAAQEQLCQLQRQRPRLRSCSRLLASPQQRRDEGENDDDALFKLQSPPTCRPRLVRALSSFRLCRPPPDPASDSDCAAAAAAASPASFAEVRARLCFSDADADEPPPPPPPRTRFFDRRPPTPSPARKRLRLRPAGPQAQAPALGRISSPELVYCDSAQLEETPPAPQLRSCRSSSYSSAATAAASGHGKTPLSASSLFARSRFLETAL